MISSTTGSTTEQTAVSFEPNEEQQLRDARLRRFNRLAVYLPIGLTAVVLMCCLGFLVCRAVVPAEAAFFSTLTLSGIADLLLILVMLPLIILLALITGGAVYGLIYWQQQSQKRPPYERDRLRLLLWKLGNILDEIQHRVTAVSNRATQPLITANARLNQAATTVNQLLKPKPEEPQQ